MGRGGEGYDAGGRQSTVARPSPSLPGGVRATGTFLDYRILNSKAANVL